MKHLYKTRVIYVEVEKRRFFPFLNGQTFKIIDVSPVPN